MNYCARYIYEIYGNGGLLLDTVEQETPLNMKSDEDVIGAITDAYNDPPGSGTYFIREQVNSDEPVLFLVKVETAPQVVSIV